jgi:GNAT superfamily N-acetyltransferase
MPRISAIRALIRDEGIVNLPRLAFESLRFLDFHIFVIDRGDLLSPPAVSQGVTMYADALDRLKRARQNRTDLANEFRRDELSGASHCATLELNGELGGVVWAYDYPAERPIIALEPGDAELSTSYTMEKFRGRGLYRSLLYFATEWQLRVRPRLFTIVASNNPTPMKAVYQVGFHEIGVIRRRAISGPKFSVAKMKADR